MTLSPIRALRVQRRLSGGADELRFAMALNAGLNLENDAEVNLELGWGDSGSTVFNGRIIALNYSLTEVQGTAQGRQKDLFQTRADQTFVDQKAGDVVKALADKAGIETGTIDDGIQLPRYLAHGNLSFFDHVRELARVCGVDVFTDRDGKLNFTRREAFTADFTYQYGINLVDARIQQAKPAVAAVEVVPESPASKEGDEASSWIAKSIEDLAATAGEGNVRRFSNALCTTKETAETAARSYQRDLQRRATRGKILIPGEAAALPGQVVELKDMPDGISNGYYEINGIDHALDAIRGFRSTLHLWGQA